MNKLNKNNNNFQYNKLTHIGYKRNLHNIMIHLKLYQFKNKLWIF
jgi:hypothetical protein